METNDWNVGTVIWVAFAVLLLWGLLAALWDWATGVASTWGTGSGAGQARRPAAPEHTPLAEIQDSLAGSEGENPWAATGFGPAGDPKIWCGTCAGSPVGVDRGPRGAV